MQASNLRQPVPPVATQHGISIEPAPPLPAEVVCELVNRLPDTRSLAMLGYVSRYYAGMTLPMLRFLDPMVRHRQREAEPPRWLLTQVAGHLCRLAMARSHRQPERQARLTVRAVLAQVAQLQDARQRARALDGEALRHIVWVADHGKDVPDYFRLVLALPPALCMAICLDLLQAPPLRIQKAGELSVQRHEQAPNYYVAIEAFFIEQVCAAAKADVKSTQPGQAQRRKALMALLPDVIARLCALHEQGHASGGKLVTALLLRLDSFIDRAASASVAEHQRSLRRLFEAILRYVVRHFASSGAEALLPRLQSLAQGSGCMNAGVWRELLAMTKSEAATARRDAEPPNADQQRPAGPRPAQGRAAPVGGVGAGALGANACGQRQ